MGGISKATRSRRENIAQANKLKKEKGSVLGKTTHVDNQDESEETHSSSNNSRKVYVLVKREVDHEGGDDRKASSGNVRQEPHCIDEVVVKTEICEDEYEGGDESDCSVSGDISFKFNEYGNATNPSSKPCAASEQSTATSNCNNNRCLLCYKSLVYHGHGGLTESVAEANFHAMFVLRKLLHVPRAKLKEYLRTFGNPYEWIGFCRDCQPLVYDSLRIQRDITELEERLRQCQDRIIEAIKTSRKQEKEILSLSKSESRRQEGESRVANETRNYVCTQLKLSVGRHPSLSEFKEHETLSEPLSYEQRRCQKIFDFGEADGNSSDAEARSSSSSAVDEPPMSPLQLEGLSAPLSPTSTQSTEASTTGAMRKKKRRREKAVFISIREEKTTTDGENGNPIVHTTVKKVQLLESPFDRHSTIGGASSSPVSLHAKQLKKQALKTRRGVKKKVDVDNTLIELNAGSFSCQVCPELPSMPFMQYMSHILFHFRRPFKCVNCKSYFSSVAELGRNPFMEIKVSGDHICSVDSLEKVVFHPDKIWKCGELGCPEKFDTTKERDEHERHRHGDKLHDISLNQECSVCLEKFRNLAEMLLHRAIMHPEVAVTSCLYCNENFKAKSKEGIDILDVYQLKSHILKCHSNVSRAAIFNDCDFCGMSFLKPGSLNLHMEQKHNLDKKCSYSCPVCFTRGRFWQGISIHLAIEHATDFKKADDAHFCELCGFKTSDSCKLLFQEHRFTKHGIEPKDGKIYKCSKEDCSFQTTMRQNLRKHLMKSHGDPREHICQVCGKGFLNGKHLEHHEQIHLNADKRPFKCEICGNSFAVKNYLYIHKRLSHENRPFASTNKKRKRPQMRSKFPSLSATVNDNLSFAGNNDLATTDQRHNTSVSNVPIEDSHNDLHSVVNQPLFPGNCSGLLIPGDPANYTHL